MTDIDHDNAPTEEQREDIVISGTTYTCPHCRQAMLFDGTECDCSGAALERAKDQAKYVALSNLTALFGAECQERQLTPCDDGQYSLLVQLAMAVIEEQIEEVTVNLNGYTKAKICLNAKGKCIISRNNSSVFKLEG